MKHFNLKKKNLFKFIIDELIIIIFLFFFNFLFNTEFICFLNFLFSRIFLINFQKTFSINTLNK